MRSLAGAFQFSGDEIDKKIRALSGGEKTRLVLARMLLYPPNFLVLDEPTNHLDLATKDMLLDALKDFDGTMLFVSHDRAFLKALSNRVLELGGESGTDAEPHLYPGSYVEYVERTGHEAPGVHTLAEAVSMRPSTPVGGRRCDRRRGTGTSTPMSSGQALDPPELDYPQGDESCIA